MEQKLHEDLTCKSQNLHLYSHMSHNSHSNRELQPILAQVDRGNSILLHIFPSFQQDNTVNKASKQSDHRKPTLHLQMKTSIQV